MSDISKKRRSLVILELNRRNKNFKLSDEKSNCYQIRCFDMKFENPPQTLSEIEANKSVFKRW